MKEMLTLYAQYNAWANKRIIDVMLGMPIRSTTIETAGSFPSLRETALHMWSAEFRWMQRLKHIEDPLKIQELFIGVFRELCSNWERTSQEVIDFANAIDEEGLRQTISFKGPAGADYTIMICDVLHHMFNHATLHRGQLITQLRMLGVTEIPWTDFVGFAVMKRENKLP